MSVFSDKRFGVDVLKVEVPVNMAYVEGFTEGEVHYSQAEAIKAFQDQEAASHLPYIYLSAGVSAKLFKRHYTLQQQQVLNLAVFCVGVPRGQDPFQFILLKERTKQESGYALKASKILTS